MGNIAIFENNFGKQHETNRTGLPLVILIVECVKSTDKEIQLKLGKNDNPFINFDNSKQFQLQTNQTLPKVKVKWNDVTI